MHSKQKTGSYSIFAVDLSEEKIIMLIKVTDVSQKMEEEARVNLQTESESEDIDSDTKKRRCRQAKRQKHKGVRQQPLLSVLLNYFRN